MNQKAFNGIFVCCICEARHDYYDTEAEQYFCSKHDSKDLPITLETNGCVEK